MAMTGIFEVDEAKCVKCGACVRDCAFGALKMADGAPRMVFPERCMKCQHCLAICPTGAVTFDGRRPEDSVPVKDLALPTLDEVENWMRGDSRGDGRHSPHDAVLRDALRPASGALRALRPA